MTDTCIQTPLEMEDRVPKEFVQFVKDFVGDRLYILEQKRQSTVKKEGSIVSLTREIRSIMHTLGDYKKPQWDSVFLVENILRQQMNLLISKANECVDLRGGDIICCDDLLFLLRRNKVKLKRLLVYLSVKDARDVISKPNSTRISEVVQSSASGKRVKRCLEFLSKIDNFFEFVSIMEEEIEDPALMNRNARKYEMVSNMSDREYLDFTSTSQTSFINKGGSELFLNWLLEDCDTSFYPDDLALDIINYLARETIAEILDIVFFLRQNKSEKTHSPTTNDLLFRKINEIYENDDYEVEEKELKNPSLKNNAITVTELQEAMKLCTKDVPCHNFFKVKISLDSTDIQYPDYLLCC